MNKLITTMSIIVLCGFFTTSISTAEAAQRSSKHHGKTKAHSHRVSHSRHHYSRHHSRSSHVIAQHNDGKHGTASWYGSRFQGKKTANGERYDMYALTAAHNTLPLSSYVEVTNLKNQRRVVVRINDRGPFHGNRVMDLSYAAAKELGIQKSGTAAVKIRPLFENQALSQSNNDQPG